MSKKYSSIYTVINVNVYFRFLTVKFIRGVAWGVNTVYCRLLPVWLCIVCVCACV